MTDCFSAAWIVSTVNYWRLKIFRCCHNNRATRGVCLYWLKVTQVAEWSTVLGQPQRSSLILGTTSRDWPWTLWPRGFVTLDELCNIQWDQSVQQFKNKQYNLKINSKTARKPGQGGPSLVHGGLIQNHVETSWIKVCFIITALWNLSFQMFCWKRLCFSVAFFCHTDILHIFRHWLTGQTAAEYYSKPHCYHRLCIPPFVLLSPGVLNEREMTTPRLLPTL